MSKQNQELTRLYDMPTVSISEHLKGIAAARVPGDVAISALESNLKKFGPVERFDFRGFDQGLSFLCPLKSFTTRFLILERNDWSIFITDMWREVCGVDVFSVSRMTGCPAIAVFAQENRRELHVFEKNKQIREVQSSLDGDRWYYLEMGDMQGFEKAAEYTRKKKRERLLSSTVKEYFKAYTGLDFGDWQSPFSMSVGLQRSTKNIEVPIRSFRTDSDVSQIGKFN